MIGSDSGAGWGVGRVRQPAGSSCTALIQGGIRKILGERERMIPNGSPGKAPGAQTQKAAEHLTGHF